MVYEDLLNQAGQQFNVDPALLRLVMGQESSGDPSAVSPKGASGLMQLMPGTAQDMGVTDIKDPKQNIFGGAKYLSAQLDKYGDVPTALAAYNAGPGAVDKHGGIPPFPETQAYVRDIVGRYQGGAKMPQQTQMPGLPPAASAASGSMVDPFAGLQGSAPDSPAASSVPAPTAQGMVDPFAGLDSSTPKAVAAKSWGATGSWTEAPSGLEALAGGLGHGFGTTMLGAQQLIGRGLTAAGSDQAGPWLTKDAEQGLKNLDAQYQPLSDAHPVIAGTGNVGGQIGATMLPAGAISKLAPAYSALGLGGRVALGAAQGAAGAAMMPVNDPSSFWQQKAVQTGLGAGMGAVFPAVTAGASALGKSAWNVVQPVLQPQRFVGQGIAGGMDAAEAAQAASNIRSAQQFVPGSTPTTAQAAQTPFMVQTEKAAANIPAVKTGMLQRGIDNNDARWQALTGVAQTPEALAAAQTARSTATQPLYDAANQQTTNVGKAFINFAQRPAVQQAMQTADTLAKNEGVQLKWPTPDDRAISGQALDYTNRALGDLIGSAKRSGNDQQARALTEAQDYLKSWTQSYIPGVRQAAQTYAQMSVPVNTMEAGQQIANSLGTRAMNAGGVADMTLNGYRTALGQAMKGAEFGIDSGAHQTLQGIGQDLQRQSISNSIRSPGSDTAYNLAANGWLAKQLYGPSFEGASGLGRTIAAGAALATGHPMAAGGIFVGGNKIGQMVGGRLQDRLSGLLLNPNSLLPYLDARAASTAQPVQSALTQGLLNYGRPAVTGGSIGLLGSLIKP